MLHCDRCQAEIPEAESHVHLGQTLCEDCYMDTLSPARTCDPWAVHSAKTMAGSGAGASELTEIQRRILRLLAESGGLPLDELCRRLEMKPADVERQIAALRHMEKVRGALVDGVRLIRLW